MATCSDEPARPPSVYDLPDDPTVVERFILNAAQVIQTTDRECDVWMGHRGLTASICLTRWLRWRVRRPATSGFSHSTSHSRASCIRARGNRSIPSDRSPSSITISISPFAGTRRVVQQGLSTACETILISARRALIASQRPKGPPVEARCARGLKAFLVAANPPVTRPLPSRAIFYRLAAADIPA